MKLYPQVFFWLAVILLLTLLFGIPNNSYTESFYFVAMLLPVIVGTSYFFNEFLVPRYLFNKKPFKFILYSIYMIIISMYLEIWVITLAFIFLANYQYKEMIPVTTNVFVLAITLYCIVFIYGFILLARRLFLNQQALRHLELEQHKQKTDYLVVRVDRKMRQISLSDILYLESLGDYLKIHTSKASPVVTKEKISSLSEKLPGTFLRIHRSFVVNTDKIESFTKEEIILKDGNVLPISRTYKKFVIEALTTEAG